MKCRIQWIDCSGEPTPDENEAVGIAVTADGRQYPICAEHLATLQDNRVHHEPVRGCSHSRDANSWSFQPFPIQ